MFMVLCESCKKAILHQNWFRIWKKKFSVHATKVWWLFQTLFYFLVNKNIIKAKLANAMHIIIGEMYTILHRILEF